MRQFIKYILISTLFVLCSGINETTAQTPSDIPFQSECFSDTKDSALLTDEEKDVESLHIFHMTDAENIHSSAQYSSLFFSYSRSRRLVEYNAGVKSITVQISLLKTSLTQKQSRIYRSDQLPEYAQVTCDYYVFALRQILI